MNRDRDAFFHRVAEAAIGLALALLCVCIGDAGAAGDDVSSAAPSATTCPLGADDPVQCPADPFLPM